MKGQMTLPLGNASVAATVGPMVGGSATPMASVATPAVIGLVVTAVGLLPESAAARGDPNPGAAAPGWIALQSRPSDLGDGTDRIAALYAIQVAEWNSIDRRACAAGDGDRKAASGSTAQQETATDDLLRGFLKEGAVKPAPSANQPSKELSDKRKGSVVRTRRQHPADASRMVSHSHQSGSVNAAAPQTDAQQNPGTMSPAEPA